MSDDWSNLEFIPNDPDEFPDPIFIPDINLPPKQLRLENVFESNSRIEEVVRQLNEFNKE